ncbi:FAD:protein FMN transferase [Defluviimonas sp. WL0002]|uniref:FAD:protein FMN transferase n=1 Tax=Albidovulum marisflavi TaxID=2984159 RepID=A0ABT2ZC01_9RHOB|nr:FAD:protein FMN transferase [Defluviimonas sp. WL0002]MCV2868673.1 FAD:protein FMN transferase [Defluviimonas sp. WL0002]
MIQPTRRQTLGLVGAALLWPTAGRAEAVHTFHGSAFGTSWRITGPAGSGFERLRPAIERAFSEVDRQMSPWRKDSEISRFNTAPAGSSRVGRDTARVIAAALALAAESGGAFDPTVGPLVAQWGFGPITGGAPNWRGVSIGEEAVAKDDSGLTLDLCGIAKGWALDRAIAIARAADQACLIMDLGGELAVLGSHPSGRPWRVAVEHPTADAPPTAVLELPSGRAVATSSLKAQSYGVGDTISGHIIDPARRRPASGQLRSVTVTADDATTADGWATALFAAGAEAGPALARARGVSALFLIGDDPVPRQVRTGDIAKLLL